MIEFFVDMEDKLLLYKILHLMVSLDNLPKVNLIYFIFDFILKHDQYPLFGIFQGNAGCRWKDIQTKLQHLPFFI